MKVNLKQIKMLEALQEAHGWKFLAMDRSGDIFAYMDEPYKQVTAWRSDMGVQARINPECALAKMVNWEDEEALNIEDLIKRYYLAMDILLKRQEKNTK